MPQCRFFINFVLEMKKAIIDRETVQRIIDTADIVEVVSDFVSLQRRGANYIGLCPFHNERTPSFSVSRAKGICKCFSCGKGGSPVNFIMEHEQLGYWDALRYLARKYHIEVREHEMTDEERDEHNARQAMLGANDFAMQHFERNLKETPDGREIGLSYFRQRGINDWAIERFHLGYALEISDDLYEASRKAGYPEQVMIDTGLCMRNDRGRVYDRFRGRVIYPVFTLSGRVVAFGGRTLKTDKSMAKYVNSPESLIYSKKNELYGLYQAKGAIVKQNKCILVEGYMDVISMHQSGVENVVASSGTSLTPGQIRLIHRFTSNVTVIYDSDPAGIKASLRGIDMLLAEGLDIKVLLLPDGDDPDSFAQSHTSEEVERYIAEHETDFIRFKTDILLKDCATDPIRRADAISNIVQSIATIPNEIKRQVYVKECAISFGIDEAVLNRQVVRDIASLREKRAREAQRGAAIDSIEHGPGVVPQTPGGEQGAMETSGQPTQSVPDTATPGASQSQQLKSRSRETILAPQERALLSIVLKYGMLELGEEFCEGDGSGQRIRVIDFVADDLAADDMTFTNAAFQHIYEKALALRDRNWDEDWQAHLLVAAQNRDEMIAAGRRELEAQAKDLAEIHAGEQLLAQRAEEAYAEDLHRFARNYLERMLSSDPDDAVRTLVTNLIFERHQLSKIFTKNNSTVERDDKRLDELVPRALLALKYDAARCETEQIRREIASLQSQPDYDIARVMELLQKQARWQQFCSQLATQLGERVYEPLR